MKKKLLAIAMMIVTMLLVLTACRNSYEYKEEDFRLTVTVDKTEARVGDTVTVTATFENLSGRNIWVRAGSPSVKRLEDVLQLGAWQEYRNVAFGVYDDGGLLLRWRFKKDAVIEKQMEIVIQELSDYVASAAVIFRVGREHERKGIDGERVIIIVKE